MKTANRLLAAVGPTQAAAESGAGDLARRRTARVLPFSLARYLRSPHAPPRVVLCPAGDDLAGDIAFLRDASRRLLWPRASALLAQAIEGMLGREEPPSAGRRRIRREPSDSSEEAGGAYFVEGTMTPDRAEALAGAGIRNWIAVDPRAIRIGGRLFARLDRLGVRWLALDPVEALGVLASPALARSRRRWKHWLPRATRVWVRGAR